MFVRVWVNKHILIYTNTLLQTWASIYSAHAKWWHWLWLMYLVVGKKSIKLGIFAPSQESTFSKSWIRVYVWLTMWQFHTPSNSQFFVCTTWNLHGMQKVQKVWNMSLLNKQSLKAVKFSEFQDFWWMSAWRVLMINFIDLKLKRTKHRSSAVETSSSRKVFRTNHPSPALLCLQHLTSYINFK